MHHLAGYSLPRLTWAALALSACLLTPACGEAGTLVGRLRDQNWYARYQTQSPGVGYYEFAVNANGNGLTSLGGADDTDIFGAFQMAGLPGGTYAVASWDVWWRSAFAFNVLVPASGSTPELDLRLNATMWGYAAFWDDMGHHEFGQTFVATGPVTMFYLRDPLNESFTRRITVHDGGPNGAQVGQERTYGNGGDQRLIYGYGQMPTIAGRAYYVRIRTPSSTVRGVLRQMDPRPDYSDPMPEGCLWVGDGTTLTALPDRDLGLVIMSDDDGLITDLFARSSGSSLPTVSRAGQTFMANGVGLISAAFWLADPSAPTYVVTVRQDGPTGATVGTQKRGKPARLFADPEMIVVWAPGECRLERGRTYYLEITRDGGGTFNNVYVNTGNPYSGGQAYQNGTSVAGTDLAGTIMEEESEGSAARRPVEIQDLEILEAGRSTNQVTISWRTPVPADSQVEFSAETPPYVQSVFQNTPTTLHRVTISNLFSHTPYHFRVSSRPTNTAFRLGVSRDIVAVTKPMAPNLLANPSFEDGTGASPRPIVGWSTAANFEIKAANGTWFDSLKPTNGAWLCQGAYNGGQTDGVLYQRVSGVTPGLDYTFSAWVLTSPRENGTRKYDVWYDPNRLIHVRLGLDPTGGVDPASANVQWTPRMYSHLHYTHLAKRTIAQATNVTVFVRLQGSISEWHLYGVDDCALTHEENQPRLEVSNVLTNNRIPVTLIAPASKTFRIEGSTNLQTWSPLASFPSGNGFIQFSIPQVSNYHHRYFRARRLP